MVAITSVGTPLLWVGFTIMVMIAVSIDLGVFNRKAHVISPKEALIWSLVWMSLSTAVGGAIHYKFGQERALLFATAYVLELALSVDNLFVFLVVFTVFKVPQAVQHRVLFWGVLGALIMRAFFIVLGTALVQQFHWVLYIMGAILVLTAYKLFTGDEESVDPENNAVLKAFRKLYPMTDDYRGTAFFVVENGKRMATPLAGVLVVIESSDLLFAVDSIPAVLAVSQDPFIVFTSNAMAILGLRSMFFLLASAMASFRFLKLGLAIVLAFIGIKLLISGLYHIPVQWSLGVVGTLIFGSIGASYVFPAPKDEASSPTDT